jgi:hypothetical protein
MKKTTLYLDADTDFALRHIAARMGVTKAELMRRALREAVEAETPPKPLGRGCFEGPPDLGKNHDHYLAESGFGER